VGESRSPNSQPASSGPAARFIAGDPIRAIAALGVFLLHAGAAAVIAAQWGQVIHGSRTPQQMFGSLLGEVLASVGNGVPIFFALSGYLIVRPFARAFIDEGRPPGIVRYLRHRAFRILPAFWVVLTALIIIWGVSGASVRHVAAMYAFNVNWQAVFFGASHRLAPAWSMNVEVRFYLGVVLLAIALVLLRRPLRRWRWARVALLPGASGAAFIVTLIAYRHTTQAAALSLPTQFYAFVPGLVLASIEPLIPERMPHARLMRWLGAVIAAAGIFALCAYNFLVLKFISLFSFSPNLGGRLYLALMSSAIVGGPLLYQWAGGGCWRILDNAPLRWLGTRSYAFYLIHFAVLISLAEVLHGIGGYKVELVVIVAAAFALTALLSEISYRLVELPCQRLARRIGRSGVVPVAQAPPAADSGSATAEQTATLIQT
jgi:peptidoglycan/LPS O-acetylase OafA/YrhL